VSTGGCALSNQPHWVVSRVAGSRCSLPGLPVAGTTDCALAAKQAAAASAAAMGLITVGSPGGRCERQTLLRTLPACSAEKLLRLLLPDSRLHERDHLQGLIVAEPGERDLDLVAAIDLQHQEPALAAEAHAR